MGTAQLVSVTLNGFRRFEDARLTVDTKIVALLGPNEAGQPSLLDALAFLNGDKEFEDTDLSRDLSSPAESPVVSALFSLDDDDRKAVRALGNSPSTRWWTVSRTREKLVTRLDCRRERSGSGSAGMGSTTVAARTARRSQLRPQVRWAEGGLRIPNIPSSPQRARRVPRRARCSHP